MRVESGEWRVESGEWKVSRKEVRDAERRNHGGCVPSHDALERVVPFRSKGVSDFLPVFEGADFFYSSEAGK
ncbi:MAG: hypothetical protein D6743_19300 [Calditrichaeota bacterium]|nr:MAG: hypothetical protein D6743_19300 [Calditrichota bacterium]